MKRYLRKFNVAKNLLPNLRKIMLLKYLSHMTQLNMLQQPFFDSRCNQTEKWISFRNNKQKLVKK